jgi:hypothetical protein
MLVMPVTTGIQVRFQFKFKTAWIPASAGMTEEEQTASLALL